MKKVVLFFVFLFITNIAKASEEVIILDVSSINRLTVPKSPVVDYVQDNSMYHNSDDDADISFSEEDLPENKALRMFYKFVDDKAVNNKLNKFTSSMIDQVEETSDCNY